MNEYFLYLLRVSAGIAIVTIPYYLLMRNDTNLVVKRLYLVTGVALSWILPWVQISKPAITTGGQPIFYIDPGSVPAIGSPGEEILQPGGVSVPWLLLCYVSGTAIFLLLNFFAMRRIRTRAVIKGDNNDLVYTEHNKVFTIFRKVFLPLRFQDHGDLNTILLHERAHIRQMHFIDLLVCELSLALTWFNPFSWLISRMIKENHEHLADRAVLSQGVNPAHYKSLLLNHAMGGEVFRLGLPFNHSLTKKRFMMMKKSNATRKGLARLSLAIPMVLATMIYVTAQGSGATNVKGTILLSDSGEPATGASIVVKGTTLGTVVDREGHYKIDIGQEISRPEIVISYVGYKTEVMDAKKASGKTISLSPKPFVMDLDRVEKVSKNEDVRKVNGEVFYIVDDARKVDGEVFYIVEDVPSFPGGIPALQTYISENLDQSGVKSEDAGEKVLIQFRVNTDGSISDVKAKEGKNSQLVKKALQLVKGMPAWNPGSQRGKAVSCYVILPVTFSGQE